MVQIHNQLDIIEQIDKFIARSESEIEELFAKRLKEILATLSNMYNKFVTSDETSYTDLNKYNRLSKELERIATALNNDYKQVVKMVEVSQQRIYVEQYLMMMYLFEVYQSTETGFSLPNAETIAIALKNPIEFLGLVPTLEQHRNEVIRKLNIEITSSLMSGEGYWKMAERIEKAVGFSKHKARTVARTEGGRARSIADEAVTEEMKKYADIDDMWLSTLDTSTRHAHRELDGQKSDDEGYFHYKTMKARAPHLWNVASMDINCRCVKLKLINGQLPSVRRGRDYRDPGYQQRLADKIAEHMANGDTYAQAYKKANKRVIAPSVVVPFITYEDWVDKAK
ncbi:phage minor head protein [Kurthia senegalensis]|uniref:phage minor head protein n=1 Tax=Kurthia senegalensis TaxID=1033740 RepID=UPI000289AE2D|nr:phage minor head protein [Kurthia senegalensis]